MESSLGHLDYLRISPFALEPKLGHLKNMQQLGMVHIKFMKNQEYETLEVMMTYLSDPVQSHLHWPALKHKAFFHLPRFHWRDASSPAESFLGYPDYLRNTIFALEPKGS